MKRRSDWDLQWVEKTSPRSSVTLFALVENDFDTDDDIAWVARARPLIDRNDLLIILNRSFLPDMKWLYCWRPEDISSHMSHANAPNPESLWCLLCLIRSKCPRIREGKVRTNIPPIYYPEYIPNIQKKENFQIVIILHLEDPPVAWFKWQRCCIFLQGIQTCKVSYWGWFFECSQKIVPNCSVPWKCAWLVTLFKSDYRNFFDRRKHRIFFN